MIFKKSIKTNVFSMFLLLDIENMQNPSGFIRFFEIANFLNFRKVYKNHWILTRFENTISTKSENAYKTNFFFKDFCYPHVPFKSILLFSPWPLQIHFIISFPPEPSQRYTTIISTRSATEVHNDNFTEVQNDNFDRKRHRGTQR